MTTRTTFDLPGLRRAIQSGDPHYQLALYADNAEVEIVESDQAAPPIRIFRGKTAIRDWIEGMTSDEVRYRIVDRMLTENRLEFVEQCQYPDGTDAVYVRRAEVRRGQITKEWVILTLKNGSTGISDTAANLDDSTVMIDEAPSGNAPRILSIGSSRAGTRDRNLPGNFLG